MQETEIKQILEELRKVYPEYEITAFPTQQKRGRYLFVVSNFVSGGDIDDWAIYTVSPVYRLDFSNNV